MSTGQETDPSPVNQSYIKSCKNIGKSSYNSFIEHHYLDVNSLPLKFVINLNAQDWQPLRYQNITESDSAAIAAHCIEKN